MFEHNLLLFLSSLISAIVIGCAGLFVLKKDRKKPLNFIFSLVLLCTVFGIFGDIFLFTPLSHIETPMFWLKITYTVVVFHPTLLIQFIFLLCEKKIPKSFLILGYFTSFTLLVLTWFSNQFFINASITHNVLSLQTGIHFTIFSAYMFFALFFTILFGVYSYNQTKKSQILFHLFGTVLIIFGFIVYFLAIKFGFPIRIDNVFLMFYTLLMSYAITKYQVMDIRITITRVASYFVVGSLLFILVTFLFLGLFHLEKSYSFVLVFITVLLTAFLGDKFRAFLQTSLDKAFIKDSYNSDALMKIISDDSLLLDDMEMILETMAPHIDNHIHFSGLWAVFPNKIQDLNVVNYQFCKLNMKTLSKDKYYFERNQMDMMSVSTIVQTLNLPTNTTIFPLQSSNQLYGYLFVGPKLSESPFYEKDHQFFDVLANHLVILFERIIRQKALQELNQSLEIQVKDEIKKREQAMEIAQDLASQALFTQVTKGIAHEIRNPLEAIRGTAENMRDYFILEPKEELKLSKTDLGNSVFSELVQSGFVQEDGYPSTHKLLFGKQTLNLTDANRDQEIELTKLIQNKQRKAVLLNCSSTIISESERIVRIADEMLKFGTSGKGLPKDCFTDVIPTFSSEDIWLHLKQKGYLTPNGYITIQASSCDFYVELDVPYNTVASEVRSVLKKFKSAQIEDINLTNLLQRFYDLHHHYFSTKEIELSLIQSHTDIRVLGREDELMRCLMNCVKNSEQSLEHVTVKKEIRISVQAESSNGVCIVIQDTGCGIPKDHLDKVKEAFFTTKDPAGGKNVGLGLAFVTRIIEGYGGKVEIESEVGKGTIVRLFF